jgi:DNA gyrase subunit A
MPLEETASAENTLVVLTVGGFLKRVGLEEFETQKRGGKGIVGGKPKEEDAVFGITPARSLDRVLFFTNLGRCHSIESAQIPVMSRYAQGKKAASLLGLAPEEHVTFMLAHGGSFEEQPLVLLSSKGMIKRTVLSNFKKPRAGGTVAMSLAQGDSVCAGYVSATPSETMIITSSGKVVRFDENAVRVMGKTAQGVRGVRLSPGDTAIAVCPASEGLSVLVVSEKGFGKLTTQEQFRKTARGAAGVTGAKLNEKTGKVAFAGTLRTAEVVLCSKKGKFIRFASVDVRETGRAAIGVRLMKLEEDDAVSSGVLIVSG